MPRWAARCRKRRRSEFRTTNRGKGSYAIAFRSNARPAVLGLCCGRGSSWGIRQSAAGSSQRGRVCARPDPAGPAWGVGTGVGRTFGDNHVSRAPESGRCLPLLVISGLATGPPAGVGGRVGPFLAS